MLPTYILVVFPWITILCYHLSNILILHNHLLDSQWKEDLALTKYRTVTIVYDWFSVVAGPPKVALTPVELTPPWPPLEAWPQQKTQLFGNFEGLPVTRVKSSAQKTLIPISPKILKHPKLCNTGRWIKGVEGFTFYKAGWSNHRQVHLKHHSQGTDSQGGLNRFLCRLKSLLALWRNWKNVCLANAVWCILNARILAPTQVFQCNQLLAQKPTLLPSLNSDNTPTHTAWL